MPEDSIKPLTKQEITARALAERLAKLRSRPEVIAYEKRKADEKAKHGIQNHAPPVHSQAKPMRPPSRRTTDLSEKLQRPPKEAHTEVKTNFLDNDGYIIPG